MNVFSEVLFVWSAALAVSFVSGLNRELSSHSEAQAEVHAVGSIRGNSTKQALAFSTGIWLDTNDCCAVLKPNWD